MKLHGEFSSALKLNGFSLSDKSVTETNEKTSIVDSNSFLDLLPWHGQVSFNSGGLC